MNTRTKGPWRFVANGVEVPPSYSGPGYYDNPSIVDTSGEHVVGCDEYDVFTCGNKREDNIRLILTAPELLEALEKLVTDVDMRMCLVPLEHARAAIAKAKGTTQ